jgi:hypothetical protein
MELGLRITWKDEAYVRDIENEDIRELKKRCPARKRTRCFRIKSGWESR